MLASECRTVSALPLKADIRRTSWLSAKARSRRTQPQQKQRAFRRRAAREYFKTADAWRDTVPELQWASP